MKRFDVFAGYSLPSGSLKPPESNQRTKMSHMNKDSKAFRDKEQRVIRHKQKVGKLVMQDVQLYNLLSLTPSLYPFQIPITMMDAMLNTPSWQHEKTRLIAQLTLDAIAILQVSEDVEITRELVSDLAVKKLETLMTKCDLPDLPPANLGTISTIEFSQVSKENLIVPIATIESPKELTMMERVRKALYSDPTIIENSERIQEHDAKKILVNKQYGWKPQLIRQLIAPYLDCETKFALKRAYPTEDPQISFCQQDQFDGIFSMEYSKSKVHKCAAPELLELSRRDGSKRRFCICTTLLYRAAFDRDYILMALQAEIFRRLTFKASNDHSERTVVSNYKWWRYEENDHSSISLGKGTSYHVRKKKKTYSGYVLQRDRISWHNEIEWSLSVR